MDLISKRESLEPAANGVEFVVEGSNGQWACSCQRYWTRNATHAPTCEHIRKVLAGLDFVFPATERPEAMATPTEAKRRG